MLKKVNTNKKILIITHADFVWYHTSKIVDGKTLEYNPIYN